MAPVIDDLLRRLTFVPVCDRAAAFGTLLALVSRIPLYSEFSRTSAKPLFHRGRTARLQM